MIPPILYKYTYWDKKTESNGLRARILEIPEIYFRSTNSLNDPFDCQLSRGWHLKSNQEILDYLRKNHPDEKNSIDEIEVKLNNDREACLNNWDKNDIKLTDLRSGVFCLSADSTNTLLWAHYANGNQGFCVGFDTELVKELLESHRESRKLLPDCIAVEYRQELPILDPFLPVDPDWFLQRYRFKAQDWSYEQEYRFVIIKDPELSALSETERKVPISPDCIKEVILGCKIAPKIQNEIGELVQEFRNANKGIKLLKAVKSKDHFSYNFLEL